MDRKWSNSWKVFLSASAAADSSTRARIGIEDLIALVERSASCELYSLLKRPDEKWVTEHAYDHPVFVEDLVRNVASRSNAHDLITWYRVEAENFESIHHHNAYAVIDSGNHEG